MVSEKYIPRSKGLKIDSKTVIASEPTGERGNLLLVLFV